MTWAISAGGTHRVWSASGCAARFAEVSITLGSTVLHRIPSPRYSTATACANARTAAFAVTYPDAPANGATAARLDTHTTQPPPAASRCGSTAWVIRYVGRRLTVNCASKSASGSSCTRPPPAYPPTVLTSATRGAPGSPAATETARATAAGSVAST